MKKIFMIVIAIIMLLSVSCNRSEDYPNKSIQMVIPYGVGGTTDKVGRELAKALEKELGQKIVVVNQKGASGSVATKSVYKRDSDGYTMLLTADSLGTQRVMGLSERSYDDFYPVLVVANDPKVIVVKADSNYHTIEELLSDMKNNDKKVKMSYTGPGGSGHVQSLVYEKLGYHAELIPYSGGMDCIVALLGDQVDFTNANYSTVASFIESGELKILAVASNERLRKYPDTPALSEVVDDEEGYLNLAFTPLTLLIKNDTDKTIKNTLTDAAKKAVKDKDWTTFMESNMIDKLYEKYPDETSAREFFSEWQSKVCYLLHDAGVTKYDPETFDIKRTK